MKKLLFATNNAHKLQEVRDAFPAGFELLSLADVDFEGTIPEDYETLEENALQKAQYIHARFGMDCFADDTGLEVAALNGDPGVYSARYAGPAATFDDNVSLLLSRLEPHADRTARFRSVFALILEGREHLFEGMTAGNITTSRRGRKGFGYDPVFIPKGQQRTFSEMTMQEKNAISHRGRALQKMLDFLSSLGGKK
ncbi:MAG: RdgB/HAM1 family non-canonical purine NTP pyrophosphatase [Bacteroidia bacterium]